MSERGRVKFFNAGKGFGFFLRENDTDVFFHIKEIRANGIEALAEGQPVKFDVVPGKDGRPKAVNVSIGLP